MNFNYYLSHYIKKNGTQMIRLKMETSKKDVQYLDSGISIRKNQWDDRKKKVKRHPIEEKLIFLWEFRSKSIEVIAVYLV